MNKDLEQYKMEEVFDEKSKEERSISDRLYATKQTEIIVKAVMKFFGYLISVLSVGVIGFLAKLVLDYYKHK